MPPKQPPKQPALAWQRPMTSLFRPVDSAARATLIELDCEGDVNMGDGGASVHATGSGLAASVAPAAAAAATAAATAARAAARAQAPDQLRPSKALHGQSDGAWREDKREFQDKWKLIHAWTYRMASGRAGCHPCELSGSLVGGLLPKIDGLNVHSKSAPHLRALIAAPLKAAAAAAAAQQLANEKERFGGLREKIMATRMGQKLPQFELVWQLMSRGSPMLEYEGFKPLYERQLDPAVFSNMHWGDNAGWLIAEAEASVVEEATMAKFKGAKFFSVSLDEGTAVDGAAYMSVHGYVMQDWQRQPYFLRLARVTGAPDAANLTRTLLAVLRTYTGLTDAQLARAVVGIGCDGASVLHGKHNGLLAQLKVGWWPWLLSSWCFAHRGSLAAAGMRDVELLAKLTAFAHEMFNYFSNSTKRTDELREAHVAAGTPGNKLIQDVPTRWISMFPALRRIVEEWPALVMKLHADTGNNTIGAAGLYSQLVDLELFLGAHAFLPLLATLDAFLKVCQQRYIFLNDLSNNVTATQTTIARLFLDKDTRFKGPTFKDWRHVCKVKDGCPLSWLEGQLVMVVDGEPHLMQAKAPKTGRAGRPCVVSLPVTAALLKSTKNSVRSSVRQGGQLFTDQTVQRFPASPTLQAMGIVYAEYWEDATDVTFYEHLDVICELYSKPVQLSGELLAGLVDAAELRQQAPMFCALARVAAAKVAMLQQGVARELRPVASTTLLWRELTRTSSAPISSFVKLAELVLVLVPGSVEEERTFSIMKFIKDQLRNRLGEEHLNSTVMLKMQELFTLGNFPFEKALRAWEASAGSRGRYGL